MSLKYEGNAEQLLIASEKPRLQLLLSRPVDDEAPDDREISRHTPEKVVEAEAFTEDLIEDGWGNGSKVGCCSGLRTQKRKPGVTLSTWPG